jgi:hypothetical protein
MRVSKASRWAKLTGHVVLWRWPRRGIEYVWIDLITFPAPRCVHLRENVGKARKEKRSGENLVSTTGRKKGGVLVICHRNVGRVTD